MIQSNRYVHNPAQRFEEPDEYPLKVDCIKQCRRAGTHLPAEAFTAPASDHPAIALWAKADVRRGKGDGWPVDFDPVTNSQEQAVKIIPGGRRRPTRLSLPSPSTATQGPPARPADKTIRYEFVREADGWKIDEIKGAVDG